MYDFACSYTHKYILVVIEVFINSVKKIILTLPSIKIGIIYIQCSLLVLVFSEVVLGFEDQVYATTIVGRYSSLKIIAYLCNFLWKINHSERVAVM